MIIFGGLVCLLLGHHTITHGPLMAIATSTEDWVPVQRAMCLRCPWRGYRSSWGTLISKSE